MKYLGRLILLVALSGCASFPLPSSQGPRVVTLNGTPYNEEKAGKLTSWVCRDFINEGKILVEVGTFSAPELNDVGFVIYDGGDSGEATHYERKGINLRWDWGTKGPDFSFVLKPDGTGLFYDFSNARGETIKANQVFKCRQR